MRFLFFFLLIPFSVFSQQDVLLTREAEAYYEAQDYQKAKDLFEKLKGESLQPWQKDRISYNLGTMELDQGIYREALNYYSAIQTVPESAPYLSRSLFTNRAVIFFRQALNIKKRAYLSVEDRSKILYLLRESQKQAELANQAECLLQKVEGRLKCREIVDLEQFLTIIKTELAIASKEYGVAKIKDFTSKEGISYLLSGVNLAEEHVRFLQKPDLQGDLKQSYTEFYSKELASWLPLWEFQIEKNELLDSAKEKFMEGVSFLEEGKLDESTLAFLTSEAALTQVMEKLWGDDPLRSVIQKLLSSYQRALDQVPTQAAMLYLLQGELANDRELFQSSGLDLNEIDEAQEALKRSSEAIRLVKKEKARFYLLESWQWIRRLLWKLSPSKTDDPDEILELGIEEQLNALTLNRTFQTIQEKELIKSLAEQQELIFKTIGPFISSVLKKEVQEWPKQCQCKPWKLALPLFFKGEEAAEMAKRLLEHQEHYLAMAKQEEALRFWREALDKMRHPEEEEKKEEKKEEPEEKPAVQEIFRLLQNMAQEDRQPKQEEAPLKQGIRPW